MHGLPRRLYRLWSRSTSLPRSCSRSLVFHSLPLSPTAELPLYARRQLPAIRFLSTLPPSSDGPPSDNSTSLFRPRSVPGVQTSITRERKRLFQIFRFNNQGGYVRDTVKLDSLMRQFKLCARDLLLMDRGYRMRQSAILPRNNCILISLLHIRAIIFRDQVLVFDADRHAVAVFADSFQTYLRDDDELHSMPFELRVVEGILKHVCERHYRRLCLFVINMELGPVINALLRQLTDEDESEALLRRLLAVKNSLSSFEVNSAEYRTTFNELLNSDDDLLAMQLTLKSRLKPGQTLPQVLHQEVELMIESYLRQMTEMFQDAFYLRKSIESTQEIMNINLSSLRNRMIRLNLHMAMSGLGLSFGAVASSVFGMNLISGLENHPSAFWLVSGAIAIVAPSIYWACYNYSKGSHRAKRRIQDMKAVQNLLHSMEDIEHVLMNHADSSAGLDRVKMQTLLSLSSGRPVPESEIDLIFKVFDSNGDGKLSFSKYLSAINSPPESRHGWRN